VHFVGLFLFITENARSKKQKKRKEKGMWVGEKSFLEL
jgi:hypothetical protein